MRGTFRAGRRAGGLLAGERYGSARRRHRSARARPSRRARAVSDPTNRAEGQRTMSQGFDPKSKASNGELPPLQGARILAALEAAKTAAGRTLTNQKAASSLIARQHSELEAVQDAGQKL